MPSFRFFSTLILILISFFLNAQHFSTVTLTDNPFDGPAITNRIILNQLEKNKLYLKLSPPEKEFVYWTNYARLFPVCFKDSVLLPFLISQPTIKGKYSNSLIKELTNSASLPLLEPEEKLYKVAKSHAIDLSKNTNRISHQSSNGTSFINRMKKGGIVNCAAENISVGQSNSVASLLLLYLDIDLPDLGHRKNLMNPTYTKMGVSVQKIHNDQSLIVQDFSCSQ